MWLVVGAALVADAVFRDASTVEGVGLWVAEHVGLGPEDLCVVPVWAVVELLVNLLGVASCTRVAPAVDVVAVGAVGATNVAVVEVSALRGIAVVGIDRLADLGGSFEFVAGSTGGAVCVSTAERRLLAADASVAVERLVPGARRALVGAVSSEADAVVAFAGVVEFKQVPTLCALAVAVEGSAETE